MKQWLSIIAAACLLLLPVAARAADPGQSSLYQNPPVGQPLVREGDFAVRLAAELGLGAGDEESAITLLAQKGIAPANGWIPDYPMTPQIMGQLSDAMAQAAADGSVRINPGDEDQLLSRVAADMALPEPGGSAGTEPAAMAPPDAGTVDKYYASEGPPIITYYAPPPQYVYLYDWVPYPAYWYGYWFPGFYICHNFTTTVFVRDSIHHRHGQEGFHEHGDAHGRGGAPARHDDAGTRRAIVSNHFRDPVTGGRFVVDPVARTRSDNVRPSTILRGQGRTFRSVADLRTGNAVHGARPAMSQTRTAPRGGPERSGVQGQGRNTHVSVMQNRRPESYLMAQNQPRTSRPSYMTQNPNRMSRSFPIVQSQSRISGAYGMHRTGLSPSGHYSTPHVRDAGGRVAARGSAMRGR